MFIFSNRFCHGNSVRRASPIVCASVIIIRPRSFPIWFCFSNSVRRASPILSSSVIPSKELPLAVLHQWFRPRSSQNRFSFSGSAQGASTIGSVSMIPSEELLQSVLTQWFRPRSVPNQLCFNDSSEGLPNRFCLSDSVQWAPSIGSFSVIPSNELPLSALSQWFRQRSFTKTVLPRWILSPMQSCRSLHPLYSAY